MFPNFIMTWQLAAVFKILAGSLIGPFAFRILGDAGPRERIYRITLIYGFALPVAVMISGTFSLSPAALPVIAVGALAVVGVYYQLRCSAWSLSRTAIFMPLSSVVTLVLSGFILGEWQVLENTPLLVGYAAAIVGVGLLVRNGMLKAKDIESGKSVTPIFYFKAAAFTAIFGFAAFLQNVWAKTGVPPGEFLTAWYLGTLLGSCALLFATRRLSHGPKNVTGVREAAYAWLAATGIVLSLWFCFLSLMLAEQTVVLPIYAVADIAGYVVVGMVVAGEWKKFDLPEAAYFILAIAGALTIAVSR